MKRIAFVTCSSKPDFAPDDKEVVPLLIASGAHVQAIPWDSNFSDWQSFDKVVLRSCWNYHLYPNRFLAWLHHIERQGIKLFNPASIVRWNVHKSYLEKLSLEGVPLPKTVWLPKGSSIELLTLFNNNGWQKAVVKPAISATAYQTFLITLEDAGYHQVAFNTLLHENDLIVQQFIPQVQQKGEWSLIFFNKKFSHAVLKKPKASDFRVQNDFGGTACAVEPSLRLVNQAKKILALICEPLLYARIDGVEVDDQFLLMELELIEPVLFLSLSKEGVTRFAENLLL
ncbi:MAG: hypothetical protein AABY93_08245 [Bacteroidota bacterium]